MAKTVAGIKIKDKAPRAESIWLDEKHMGTEPKWDAARAAKFDDAEFDHHLRRSFRYYNYFYNQKDLKKHVVAWLQENSKMTKEQISAFILSSTDLLPMTVCSLVKAVAAGMPMKEKHAQYVIDTAMKIISYDNTGAVVAAADDEAVAAEQASKKAAVIRAPTIQDRLAEKTSAVIGELEGQVDNVYLNQPVTIKVYDFLTARNFAQAQVGKIRTHFQKQIDEIGEALTGEDAQLKEGYKHLSKADVKRIGDFYVKLMADLDSYTAVKKATKKVATKKPQSKDKLVAKVKFMKESKELKLVSIPPVDKLVLPQSGCIKPSSGNWENT